MTRPASARRARSTPRGLLALSVLLASAAAGIPRTHAANPQPYEVDWVSSGRDTIDNLLKPTSQLEQLRSKAPVDPFGLIARARGDVPRLKTVLESFGYYDGSIDITINGLALDSAGLGDALLALPKGATAHVAITPRLGPQFHIGRIDVQGALPAGMEQTLGLPGALLDLSAGAPAVASNVLAAGTELQAKLQNEGYAFAKVEKPVARLEPRQRVLDLTYRVTTGPRVRIGAIRIEGLVHVNESLVRHRLLIHTGEQYSAAMIEKARQDLLSLSVFSSISVRLGKQPDAGGQAPITFVVRESKRNTVGVSAAYSTDLGASGGISWSNRNLLGGAQQLAFSATAINLGGSASTGLGYDATLAYSVPDFYHRDQTLRLSVQALRQELEAYSENGQLFGATVSRRLSTVWNVSGGVAYEHERIGQPGATCPPPAPGTQPANEGSVTACPFTEISTYELLMLPITASYDSTNLPSPLADPTHGYRVGLNLTPSFSYSHAGTLFAVSQASLTTYYDLHRLFAGDPSGRSVIAVRLMAGLARGTVWNNLPPDQRFYAGGSGTIRGYRYQAVGPQFKLADGASTGIPEGGTTLRVLNLELRQRVGTNFGFVVFTDGGGVSQSADPFSGVFRVGVGTGVRYYTAIGPIRFDIALPTQRIRSDDRFEIYIGLGQAF